MRAGDDAFDADAVLSGGDEGAFHEDGEDFVLEIGVADGVEDYCWVFTAEFDADWCEHFGGRGANGVGDGTGADEGDVRDAWMRG